MSKGKKFNAAEKHFEKRTLKLRQTLKEQQTIISTLQRSHERLRVDNVRLRDENDRLCKENIALQKAMGLTDKQREKLIDNENALNTMLSVMGFSG